MYNFSIEAENLDIFREIARRLSYSYSLLPSRDFYKNVQDYNDDKRRILELLEQCRSNPETVWMQEGHIYEQFIPKNTSGNKNAERDELKYPIVILYSYHKENDKFIIKGITKNRYDKMKQNKEKESDYSI